MAAIAILCPPIPGHVNPLAALGRALVKRGHRVAFAQIASLEPSIRAHGLDFIPLPQPDATLADAVREMSSLTGLASLRFAVECSRRITDVLCREAPDALRAADVELILADQNEPAGGTIAERLGIPFASVCPSLPLNREPAIPPPFVPWHYSPSFAACLRNRAGYLVSDGLIAPINRTLNSHRSRWGLAPVHTPDDTFSRQAQLSQITAAFDFPRLAVPAGFHYLGPFVAEESDPCGFPFERLDGRPLIYASFGTLQEKNSPRFAVIAEACRELEAQLVIALGARDAEPLTGLAGDPIVVGFAPQLALLRRACAAITHAGLNTVMQALGCGVPLAAVPLTHDQPAIAARLARTGAGIVIPPARFEPRKLREAMQRILREPAFREAARTQRAAIEQAGGVARAVSILESLLAAKTPGAAV